MSRQSLVTLIVGSFLALAAVGCTSTEVANVHTPDDAKHPVVQEPVRNETMRAELAARRARHIDELHEYWQAKAFPINRETSQIANIFRDEEGHLCAVANMLAKDGLQDLIARTAESNNLVRLADVDSGELADWVLASGFTREEVAMIQVPYIPVKQVTLMQEQERIAQHLAGVEARLRDDTDLSLAVAERRYVRHQEQQARRFASR